MKRYILVMMSVLILIITPIALFEVIGFHYELNLMSPQSIKTHAESLWDRYPSPVFGSDMHHDYRDYLVDEFEAMGYQVKLEPFKQLTSVIKGESYIDIGDQKIDLVPARGGRSKGLDFTGELIIHNLSNTYNPEDVEGRVVISTGYGELLDAQIEKLYDDGCLGIIVANGYYLNGFIEHNYSTLDGKLMPIAYVDDEDREVLFDLAKSSTIDVRQVSFGTSYSIVDFFDAGVIEKAHIKIDKTIEIVEGYNIIASLNEQVPDHVFATHYDGGHSFGSEGFYFNTTSVATILEMANRVVSDQKHLSQNISFALFDGGMINQTGVKEHLKDVKEESAYIFLDRLGLKEHMLISSNNASKFLKESLLQYDVDYNLNQGSVNVLNTSRRYSPGADMIQLEMKSVLITADYTVNPNDYYMGNKALDIDGLGHVIDVLDQYLKVQVFEDAYPDYMTEHEWLVIILLTVLLVVMVVIRQLRFIDTIKKIYYSSIYSIFRSGMNALIIVVLTGLIILGITILPNHFTIFDGQFNYSFYSLWLNIIKTMRSFFDSGLGMTSTGVLYKDIIISQSVTTFRLIGLSLIISTSLGLFLGMIGHYFKKQPDKEQSMLIILGLSIPETVLIMLLLLSLDNIMAIPWIESHMETSDFRTFIMPLIVLSLVPTIYVARTVYMTLVEEGKKKYIISLKAKGVKKDRLYRVHLSRVAGHKVLSQSPILLAISISTMIICERMFAITGLFSTFIDAMVSRDYLLCLGIVLVLMSMYYAIRITANIISSFMMPRSGGAYEVE